MLMIILDIGTRLYLITEHKQKVKQKSEHKTKVMEVKNRKMFGSYKVFWQRLNTDSQMVAKLNV